MYIYIHTYIHLTEGLHREALMGIPGMFVLEVSSSQAQKTDAVDVINWKILSVGEGATRFFRNALRTVMHDGMYVACLLMILLHV